MILKIFDALGLVFAVLLGVLAIACLAKETYHMAHPTPQMLEEFRVRQACKQKCFPNELAFTEYGKCFCDTRYRETK